MRKSNHIFIWKKAPFLRLLLPVICGIVLAFYAKLSIHFNHFFSINFRLLAILFSFLPEVFRFRFKVIQGILISLLLLLFASFITWQKDVRNKADWYGKYNNKNSFIVATITEPLQAKSKIF